LDVTWLAFYDFFPNGLGFVLRSALPLEIVVFEIHHKSTKGPGVVEEGVIRIVPFKFNWRFKIF